MLLHRRSAKAHTLFSLGLIALIVANIVRYLLARKLDVPESVADPVTGFFFGVAIALLLWSVILRSRLGKTLSR